MGAYAIGPNQIVGGPDWLDTERFDITAKTDHPAGDHELMANIFVGETHPATSGPDDVFTISALVPGEEAAGSVADTGCKMTEPA